MSGQCKYIKQIEYQDGSLVHSPKHPVKGKALHCVLTI